MSDLVGESVSADIEGKGDFRGDGRNNGKAQQAQHAAIEVLALDEQESQRGQQNEGNDIFTDDFKRGQARIFKKTIGEKPAFPL